MVASILDKGELNCDHNDLVINHAMNSREKIHPSFIKNDRHMGFYMFDTITNSSRSILRMNIVENPWDKNSTSAAPSPPLLHSLVDDDSMKYNDVDDRQ